MKRLELIVSLLAVGLLCGCATSHVHTEFAPDLSLNGKEPAAVVVAENYGYYLFGVIPLITGDPDKPNAVSLAVFNDTVTLENNQKMIISAMDALDTPYTLTDMRDSTDWTGAFSLWIVWKQVLNSNAVAIKTAPRSDNTIPSSAEQAEPNSLTDRKASHP